MKAAANVLGVSEPAVSGALAALRQHMGDQLVIRTPTGMELTAGGQRLVTIASHMVNLAVDAEAAIRDAQGAPELLRVVATGTVAEFVAPPLLAAFTARFGGIEASVGVTTAVEMPTLLSERLADVGLGPRLTGLESDPMMRYRLIVVASPDPMSRDWLVGATGADPSSSTGQLLARLGVGPDRIRVFPNEAAAIAAAADGHGLAPTVAHIVARELDRGALVPVPVPGTPVDLLWFVSTLGGDRASAAARKLRRFLATPDAMQVMYRADASVPASRFRPPVYVTLWS